MLVMTLRTETLHARCVRWARSTTSSIEMSSSPIRSAGQPSAAVAFGTWAFSCFATCATKSSDKGADERMAISVSRMALVHPEASIRLASASALPRSTMPATICSASRRRFSIRTMRKVIATAHSSAIVSGCTC